MLYVLQCVSGKVAGLATFVASLATIVARPATISCKHCKKYLQALQIFLQCLQIFLQCLQIFAFRHTASFRLSVLLQELYACFDSCAANRYRRVADNDASRMQATQPRGAPWPRLPCVRTPQNECR